VKEISLHILDIVQNSIEAGATRVAIAVTADSQRDLLTVAIADNGRGMPPNMVAKVTDPFVTTRATRRVGLGLPLLAATARQSGGTLTVASAEGEGTKVTATFGLGNIDRPPLGDMATTLACLLAANPSLELEYRHRAGGPEFRFGATEFRGKLDGVSFSSPVVYRVVKEHVAAGVREAQSKGGIAP